MWRRGGEGGREYEKGTKKRYVRSRSSWEDGRGKGAGGRRGMEDGGGRTDEGGKEVAGGKE